MAVKIKYPMIFYSWCFILLILFIIFLLLGTMPATTRSTSSAHSSSSSAKKAATTVSGHAAPYSHAHEIIPGLFLGNEKASRDAKFFSRHKIRAVLNMTHDLPCRFRDLKNIEYGRVTVDDSLKPKDFKIMEESLPFAVSFIHKTLVLEKKPILVHCYMGAQRSAAAVAAFLMTHRPDLAPTYAKAIHYVHSKRPIAWHEGKFVNFDQALKAYRRTHLKKS